MKSKLEEYMDIVDWLNGYRRALFRIERLEEEIIRWDARAQKMTSSTSSIVSPPNGAAPAAIVAVEMMDEAEKRLMEARAACKGTRTEIEQAVMALPFENQQKVMYCIYIDLLQQKETAAGLHYSRKQVSRIHLSALEELKKMSPNVP